MELSLQRKVNAKKIFARREEMIYRERLHMDDEISYEQFCKLYEKYGKDMNEKDFARYFLDLYYEEHYTLQIGKVKKSRILTQEFVTEQEIVAIRNRVIEEYQLTPGKPLGYEPIVQMYEKLGGRLSLYGFAKEVLNVTKHTIEKAKSRKKAKSRERL